MHELEIYWSRMPAALDGIDQVCLKDRMVMFKSVFRGEQDWSSRVGGQDCLRVSMSVSEIPSSFLPQYATVGLNTVPYIDSCSTELISCSFQSNLCHCNSNPLFLTDQTVISCSCSSTCHFSSIFVFTCQGCWLRAN